MGRRALGALTLLTVLIAAGGCGDDRGSTAPAPSAPSSTAGETASGTGQSWAEVAIVTGTAAGGEVSPEPVVVGTQEALDGFVARFERSDLADKVVEAVSGADVPEGWVPVAVVVAVGCDVPPGVVVDTRNGFAVRGQKVASPMKECFAAMTSVAILTVDPAVL